MHRLYRLPVVVRSLKPQDFVHLQYSLKPDSAMLHPPVPKVQQLC